MSSPHTQYSSVHGSPAPAYSPLYPVDPEQQHQGLNKSPLQTQYGVEPVRKIDTNHPDIQSPGLESVWQGDHSGLEVVPQPPPQHHYPQPHHHHGQGGYPPEKGYGEEQPPADDKKKRRLFCGCLPLWALILIILIIVGAGVGLGVGLGLGLNKNSSNKLQAESSVLDPKYLSKTGAFNGTGLAIASYSFDKGGYGIINVYFQHWAGQIRRMQLLADGTWVGGDATTIVATDARNATPISAVAYTMDQISKWHIFYIDKDNTVREKVSSNITNTWSDGPIGKLNLKAMDHTNVGLQGCWYGSFYGSANYSHSPIPGTGTNNTSPDQVVGMHLWYGKDPTTLEEVNWTYNTTDWYKQETFVANGHAGAGCYSWGPGTVTYAMMVNLNNEVNVIWKDLDSTGSAATASHPVGKWQNTTVTIPNVMPNTSLGYTNYFYVQTDDRSVSGYNISWNAENTKILTNQNFKIPQKPLAGSHFSVTALPTKSGGDSLLVFNQANGTDVTANSRDLSQGSWAYDTLLIPST